MSLANTWKRYSRALAGYNFSKLKNMGIGKTLLLWFLVISLVPIATLSFINFFYYYQGLNILAKKSLFTTSDLRMNYLSYYFLELDNYLAELAKNQGPGHIMNSRFRPEGITNIYYIEASGIIREELYKTTDSEKNLFSGALASTRFSKTMAEILATGKTLFSDLEYYPPANGDLCGYLGKPVTAADGDIIGIVAVRISMKKIDQILQIGIVFGNTGYAYLVGTDLKIRAASKPDKSERALIDIENNEKTRTWQSVITNHSIMTPKASMVTEEADIYQNTAGKPVMGLYRNLDFLEKYGVNWVLVEEFEQEEAHMVASRLSAFAKISLLITTIMVLLISTYVTNRFVTPIKKISDWAKQVAHGELIIRDIPVANNEVGKMRDAFNWLVNSLRSYSSVSQSVSLGDFSQSVTVRSDKDVMAISMNQMVESFKDVVRQAKSIASGDYSTNIVPRSANDTLGIALFEMTRKLREAAIEIDNRDWLKSGLNELAMCIRGEKSHHELTSELISFLCRYVEALTGHLYLLDNDNTLILTASFANSASRRYPEKVMPGEGMIGQVAREQKAIFVALPHDQEEQKPGGVMQLGPGFFMIVPVAFEGKLIGVLELGTLEPFDEKRKNFINISVENIAVAINTTRSREKVQELLIKTQEQARELESQAKELEIASNYKSEFLANMSHELRTPLNSILVLSELLASNSNQTMSASQVEYATVIHSSGKDLLDLIDDILDLSKVEAGKFEIETEEMNLEELVGFIQASFTPLTDKKGIYLKTHLEKKLPESIMTDSLRVRQILKNLLSNAIKFTEKGGVTMTFGRPDSDVLFLQPGLTHSNTLAIKVGDTGIGIPPEKMKLIFEAFRQADGTINRKFGGTGLGLTISKSLAGLLGGEIQVESSYGEGSCFTLFLPVRDDPPTFWDNGAQPPAGQTEARFSPSIAVDVTGENAAASEMLRGKHILVCDDDMRNVFVISGILEEKGVKIHVAKNGPECLEKLSANPEIAILLIDMMMPGMDGLTVIREIRKKEQDVRLPVVVITARAMKGDSEMCIAAGADDYLAKPVSADKLTMTVIRNLS